MKINGLNLFPLDSVKGLRIPSGYFMDANYSVFSNRAGGRVAPLFGSQVGGRKYFRFAGLNVNFYHDVLKAAVNTDPNFTIFVLEDAAEVRAKAQAPAWSPAHTGNPIADAVRRVQTPNPQQQSLNLDSSHASSLENGIALKGYVIAKVSGESLVLASTPRVHLTEESMRKELQRLALQKAGVKYVGLKIAHSVVAAGITWQ